MRSEHENADEENADGEDESTGNGNTDRLVVLLMRILDDRIDKLFTTPDVVGSAVWTVLGRFTGVSVLKQWVASLTFHP